MKLSKISALLAAATLSLGFVQAQAAIINNALVAGINTIQDSDAERILRNGTAITTGAFQVGDVIETVLRIETVNGDNINTAVGSLTYQLNSVIRLQVASITDTGIDPDGAGALGNLFDLVFSPTGTLGAGVFAEVYERTPPQPEFDLGDSAATSIANIMAQTLIAELGIGDLDDFWVARTVNDIGANATAAGPGSPQAANGQFGLSVLSNPGSLTYIANSIQSGTTGTFHDVVGSTSVYARETGVNTDWLLSSNADIRFNVPEPGVISLMGLGLLGMGAALRKRKSA